MKLDHVRVEQIDDTELLREARTLAHQLEDYGRDWNASPTQRRLAQGLRMALDELWRRGTQLPLC